MSGASGSPRSRAADCFSRLGRLDLAQCPAGSSSITRSFHGRYAPCRSGRTRMRLVGLPRHLVKARAPQALQIDATPVHEREAAAGHELLHHLRDEDLAGLGTGADAEGGVDGRAEQAALGANGLACVDADAEPDRLTSLFAVAPREGLLDGDGAFHGARSRGEGRLHPIPRMEDLRSLIGGEALTEKHVVGANEVMRLRVARALDHVS